MAAAAAVAWIAAGVGCVPARGTFAGAGYTSTYGYEIRYVAGTQRLLPAEWALDNFEEVGNDWVRKTSGRQVTTYKLDDDEYSRGSVQTLEMFTYAVRYEHRVHGGAIWLSEIPIKTKLRKKDLRVLMQTFIDEVAGATYETVDQGNASPWSQKPQIVVEHRHAPTVLEEGPAVVAGQPAYTATIEIANIDEVRVAPRARTSRVQLVLLRAPNDETYAGSPSGPSHSYPVVLLAGYSNMPADFAKGLDDFHGMLQRLAIAGKTGFALDVPDAAQ